MDEPSFAASHVHHLVRVVQRWGVTAEDLRAGIPVPERVMVDPRARIPVPTMVALLDRARDLTREPALGLHIGLGVRPTLYGNLGFAWMSASNAREALDLTVRFSALITTGLRLRLDVEGQLASLIVDEVADFGDVRDVVVLAAIVAARQIGVALAGRELKRSVVELALPEPEYAATWGGAQRRIRFACPNNRIVWDAASLDVPYAMSDPMALSLAKEHCQRELDGFGHRERWAEMVRGQLSQRCDGCPSLEEVAATFGASPRTLKRRLAEEGVSFSTLREVELRKRALALVRTSRLPYAEIAHRLGYSKVTSFYRAFCKWTATTPAVCRRAAVVRA
jgi:AraC-like DNA-binding protein